VKKAEIYYASKQSLVTLELMENISTPIIWKKRCRSVNTTFPSACSFVITEAVLDQIAE
jgi:hypothetical protein